MGDDLTNLEKAMLKAHVSLMRHYARLSSPRDLYTLKQAAFRLCITPTKFKEYYLIPGRVKFIIRDGRQYIPAVEIDECISNTRKKKHNGDEAEYYKWESKLKKEREYNRSL